MKKELQECENRLHNYQRSQEMNNTLNEAGIEDSIENNQMIVENLLDAAKEVTDGNTEIISYIEGVNGKVQVVSRWKILPDGTPYLATVILKPCLLYTSILKEKKGKLTILYEGTATYDEPVEAMSGILYYSCLLYTSHESGA